MKATSDEIGTTGKWHVETDTSYYLIDTKRSEYTASPKANLGQQSVGVYDGIFCIKDAPMLLSAGDYTIRTTAVVQIAKLEP